VGGAAGRVTGVRLLGHPGALRFEQTATGLTMALPERAPCDRAVAFAINGMIQPAAQAGR
jgi:hypothetical protein